MKRAPQRARRGEVGLRLNRTGYWDIRWGRALARRAGLPQRESTGTRNKSEATRILDQRRIAIYRALGEEEKVDAVLRGVAPVALDVLASDFLRAYAAGELPGPTPAKGTVRLYLDHLFGERGGFLAFANAQKRTLTSSLDGILVRRWLESEGKRLSGDSLRMKLIVARRLAQYAGSVGLLPPATVLAIRGVRPPAAAKGRARVDGVPSMQEVAGLLQAIRAKYRGGMPWDRVAELQLRLGLRRAEVIAFEESWLEPEHGRVVVRVSETFDTKSHESRDVDGVDDDTFALAREVIALKKHHRATASGYKEAWKRAVALLEAQGTPWRFRAKTNALRSAYATQSRLAGIPLTVVRDRLGHASERTTEMSYLGRTRDRVPGPFEGRPLVTSQPRTD